MSEQDRDKSLERWLRQTPATGARSESACLDAETLAAWAEGLLNGLERTAAEAHASGCARCQAMLAVMVRTMPGPPPTVASPLRKWLMMLSPALAAGAAVALWFAVDQRQRPPSVDSLSRDQRVASQPSDSAKSTAATPTAVSPTAPSPAAVPENDARSRALGGSLDRTLPKRDAPQSDLQASKALTDAFKEREERAGTDKDKKVADAEFARVKPFNERKDEARTPQPVGSLPAPPPGAPVAAAESARTAADSLSAQARATPPAASPQQTSQNQSQSTNQSSNANQSQNAPRQQAAAPKADPNAGVAERVEVVTGTPVVTRDAARRGAGATVGASAGFRSNVAIFDVVPPDASARWRVVDGRTVQRSLDAGATWANQYSAEDGVILTAGTAPTSTVCWLVGRGGVIVLTTDGRDWQRVKFPEPVDLTAVSATDARTATITTANGRRFLTTDGGRNWTPQ